MTTPSVLAFLLTGCFTVTALGQSADTLQRKQYFTRKIEGPAPKIDGRLEAVWEQVPWATGFVEWQPNFGEQPAEQSAFKILYDEKNLYVAYRAFDAQPDSIVRRLSRRDAFPGDWMEINIDSYHDLRTAFSFTLSASGVRGDEFVSENGNDWDPSWNPVWFGKTRVDSLGWTAEVQIPFSQLRFDKAPEQIWGIQVMRRNFRHQERSVWQPIAPTDNGWVSFFGELHGIRDIEPPRQVEIQPYVVGKAESFEKIEGNPFATGSDFSLSAGLDGKVALTSDLILDFTLNPDFGQVEADPSVVRLDGFQNFFSERRPFFIEGRNIFNYPLSFTAAGGNQDADLLFYSRRIGAAPHHYPALAPDEYAEVPANTSILGAAKFSGKTRHGWSIGILESVTAEEKATIDREGVRRQEVVEPLTNFFVGRLQKDIRQGNTIIGGIFTAVNRRLDGTGLEDLLHRSAYAGGMDFQHFWKDRNYVFTARGVFSRVQGSTAAIAATQTAFEHLFQRPDAPHLRVDSTRTHLQGHAGTLKLAKFGGGHWRFETGLTWRSPELELNDAGFLLSTDEINQFTWVGYRIWEPFGIFRNFNLNLNQWNRWNFDGRHLYQAFNVNANTLFKNYWMTGAGLTIETLDISQNALRGGPALRRPPGWAVWAFVNSPQRRKVQFFGNGFMARAFGGEVKVENLSPGVRIQITDPLDLVLRPSFFRARRQGDQYVTQTDFQGTPRYIVGAVEQKTLQFVIRLNYAITPDLSLQYYGQPFISRATYEGFGFVQAPDARSFTERFHRFSPAQITLQGDTFEVDENEDKTVDYTFAKPDFNFVQFRSNLVLRWEYLPGSELFLVWSQSSTPDAFDDLERGLLSSLSDNLFGTKAHNIFLLKTTYRFLK